MDTMLGVFIVKARDSTNQKLSRQNYDKEFRNDTVTLSSEKVKTPTKLIGVPKSIKPSAYGFDFS